MESNFTPFNVKTLEQLSSETNRPLDPDLRKQFKLMITAAEKQDSAQDEFVPIIKADSIKKKVFEEVSARVRKAQDPEPESPADHAGEAKADKPVADTPPAPEAAPAKSPPKPDPVTLEKEKAHKEGFAAGKKEGFAKGEQDGFVKGETEGYKAGEAQARQEGEAALGRLETVIQQVESIWQDLVAANERQIIELIRKVSEKVVYTQVSVDTEVIRQTILEVFKMMPPPTQITIHVNPEEYDYIDALKDDFFANMKELQHVTVLSDPNVNAGGCKIETDSGSVDASLESRLEAVARSILEAAEGR